MLFNISLRILLAKSVVPWTLLCIVSTFRLLDCTSRCFSRRAHSRESYESSSTLCGILPMSRRNCLHFSRRLLIVSLVVSSTRSISMSWSSKSLKRWRSSTFGFTSSVEATRIRSDCNLSEQSAIFPAFEPCTHLFSDSRRKANNVQPPIRQCRIKNDEMKFERRRRHQIRVALNISIERGQCFV